MEINVRKTIENTVTVKDELPFYIDELSANDEMPTYMGMADEKYTFSEMDDDFFDFVNQKINDNGIYIRLVHIIETSIKSDRVTLNVEAGSLVKPITVKEEISSQVIDLMRDTMTTNFIYAYYPLLNDIGVMYRSLVTGGSNIYASYMRKMAPALDKKLADIVAKFNEG